MLHDVVVVGAGAAGIAAARTLREQGINPLVLEARERTGGRAWTDTKSFGIPIDMGCAWLHSADRNPWTVYAREVGFDIIERLPIWQRYIGREAASADYLLSMHAAFARNEQLIDAVAESGRDLPVSDVVPNDKHRPNFDAIMGWLMGVDTEKVSCVDYSRYQDSELNWSLPSGLGALVSHAAAALDVRLATPVRMLDYRGKLVKIETDSGTIESRTVIVTIPTSLLSRGDIGFLPELPLGLQEAFAGVPLGSPNKVFFRMANGAMPFEGTTNFIGTADDKHTASYEARSAGQDVLMAFFGGSLSLELEQRGQLESFAREELSRIFGTSFNAQLLAAVTTGWSEDPWSRGSYSAALPGCADMRGRMREPLDEKIFFAGEACSPDYFGTLIGASQTGVAAAKQVAAIIAAR